MYLDDPKMQAGLGPPVATFPAFGDPDYATSGLTIGVDSLAGSVRRRRGGGCRPGGLVLDRPELPGLVAGHAADAVERDRRTRPTGLRGRAAAGSRARRRREGRCRCGRRVLEFGSAIRIRVAVDDAAATAKVLKRHGAEVARIDLADAVLFVVANRKDLSYDEHPFFTLVIRDLEAAGVMVQAASLP